MNVRQATYAITTFILSYNVFLNNAHAYLEANTGEVFIDAMSPFMASMLLLAPWIWAFTDILKNEFSVGNKVKWLAVVWFIPVIGFILYVIIGRKQKITLS